MYLLVRLRLATALHDASATELINEKGIRPFEGEKSPLRRRRNIEFNQVQ